MSRYYKAKDVIMFLNMKCPKDMWEYQIADLPTIDIVRCKECKFAEKCEQIVVFDITENQVEGRKIDFCSYGERIDNE